MDGGGTVPNPVAIQANDERGRVLGVDAAIGLAGGLVGVLVGALLAAGFGARASRIDRTFEMHREFEAPEMLQARYRASELLAAHPGPTYTELRQTLGRTAMNDVWAVTGFYQRLWLAIRHRAVQPAYVPELFGDTFVWWCDNSFHSQLLPTRSERAHHVRQLEDWMLRHSSSEMVARWRVANELSPIAGRPVSTSTDQDAGSAGDATPRPR
jgi:hypothetical protein